jgi:hypothetical protein
MARDTGKPSGINKSEGIGTPSKAGNEEQDRKISEKYTNDENELKESVRERHPNRNTDKDDATNAGGYKQ